MKSIDELCTEIQEENTMDDIVKAIIYKSEQKMIPKSQAFLQQAFYDLKNEASEMFSDFIFDESGVTPFSDELDSVVFRLEASSVLSTLNPTYKNYEIKNSPELLKKSYDKLQSQSDVIDKCALSFSEMVKRRQ